MAEPFDEYADQFQISVGAFGVNLNFGRTQPKPPAPGTVPPAQELGTIRMSIEHTKVMIFLMHQQVRQAEGNLRVSIPVSTLLLNELRIAPEDWAKFWQTAG